MDAADPTENLSFYNEEMEQCALDYAAYVLELSLIHILSHSF